MRQNIVARKNAEAVVEVEVEVVVVGEAAKFAVKNASNVAGTALDLRRVATLRVGRSDRRGVIVVDVTEVRQETAEIVELLLQVDG